jgi:hypothetical protein
MDHTKLLKNYVLQVLMFSERLNLNYYVKLTEGSDLESRTILQKFSEAVYDNHQSADFVKFVNNSYAKLAPYIEDGNLTVASNMKALVSDAIRFLIEDLKNIDKLASTGIENVDTIKQFSNLNIERLRRILDLI